MSSLPLWALAAFDGDDVGGDGVEVVVELRDAGFAICGAEGVEDHVGTLTIVPKRGSRPFA
ncbi:hypothetical protein D3C83_125470 [compost metagenome]